MLLFSETKELLNPTQIEEIENYVNLKFPEEYKKHLLKYNGGIPSPNIFSFIENGEKTDSCINRFLAIYDGSYNNLKEYLGFLKIDHKRMPTHILPIADDPLGNFICISCGIKDYGFVYFWDHEKEVDYSVSNDYDYSNLHLISNSFNEFINELREEKKFS